MPRLALVSSRADTTLEHLPRRPYPPQLPCCRQVDLHPQQGCFLAVWGDHASFFAADTGQPAAADCVPEQGLRRARFSPDGERVAVGTRDERLLLWDWRSRTVLLRSPRLGDCVDELRWLPDGELVSATQSNQVLRHREEDLEPQELLPRGPYEPFGGLAASPDGKRLFLASGQRLRCLDADSGEVLWEQAELDGAPRGPTVSPDGSRVAVAGPASVTLVDAATGGVVARADCYRYHGIHFPGLPEEGLAWSACLAFSPDGARLASSTPNGQLMLLDPADLTLLQELPRQPDGPVWIEDLAWFADGRRLLVGCAHGRVMLWDADRSRCIHNTPLAG